MCVHHEVIDTNCEPPCHCEGDESGHYHAECRLCGQRKVYPAVSVYDQATRAYDDPALITLINRKREVWI